MFFDDEDDNAMLSYNAVGDSYVPRLSSGGHAPSHLRRRSDGIPEYAGDTAGPVGRVVRSQRQRKDDQRTSRDAVLPRVGRLCQWRPYQYVT